VIAHGTNWRKTRFRPLFWPIAVATFFLVSGTADAFVTIATTDASTGNPLSEVRVVFRIGSVSRKGTTDTEGNCKMVGTNLVDACITVQKEGWCPMKLDLAENPPENSTIFSHTGRRLRRGDLRFKSLLAKAKQTLIICWSNANIYFIVVCVYQW